MANLVPSGVVKMDVLFPACVEVLREEQRPMHYAELTRKALARLGYGWYDVPWHKQIEDVREKLLLAGSRGTAYVGMPYCVGVLKEWFPSPERQVTIGAKNLTFRQQSLNMDSVVLPLKTEICIEAMVDTIYRFHYMQTKAASAKKELGLFPEEAEETIKEIVSEIERYRRVAEVLPNLDKRVRGAARGKLIEFHVADWFRRKWPENYEHPPNRGRWSEVCKYDFSLRFGDRVYLFDVAGPGADGMYGPPYGGGKKPVDFHVFGDLDNNSVLVCGFMTGKNFTERTLKEFSGPLIWLIVYLNCAKLRIPYGDLLRRLHVRQQKKYA